MTEAETYEGDSEAGPEDLVKRLRVLTRAMQDFLAARAKERELGTTDFIALIRASNGEGITGAQLARAFGMRSSSVTGLADRLEAKGLIARRPHPTDRRTILLHATGRGRQTVTRALGPLLENLTGLAGEFDANERAAIAAFLDGIGEVLETEGSRETSRGRRG
jgi:DNA-binding MarR family transcriptional regulator